MSEKEPFRLYFAGGEVAGWRKLLHECGVRSQLLSFYHLYKRIKKARKEWRLEDNFHDDTHLFLDSGGFTANSNSNAMEPEEWGEYAEAFYAFVERNIDRIDIVAEFDAFEIFDDEELNEYRDKFHALAPNKFMPVWHAYYGMKALPLYAKKYPRVGINEGSFKTFPGLRTKLNSLTTQYGTKFHGFAITKPDIVLQTKFQTVDSTSWISGTKYGDTIWFVNGKLHRYPYEYKRQSRKRHYMDFKKAGLDADGIVRDETDAVNRMTIYAWQQLEDYVNRRRLNSKATERKSEKVEEPIRRKRVLRRHPEKAEVATNTDDLGNPEIADWAEDEPAISEDEGGNSLATLDSVNEFDSEERKPALTREVSERGILPVVGFEQVMEQDAVKDDEGNVLEPAKFALVPGTKEESLRVCNNCYVSANCPAFKPDHKCAFNLPLEVRTKDQMFALLRAVIEMQGQRVLFGKFVEDLEGGYADQNLSNEVDRLFNMVQNLKNITDNRDFVKLTVESKGNAGILSRIFGDKVGDQARGLTQEHQLSQEEIDKFTNKVMTNDPEIVDADIVE